MDISKKVEKYLELLTKTYSDITSIWVIGSRANNTSKDNSDWDLLIFAKTKTLVDLSNRIDFYDEMIDLLIVYNNNGDFKCPWYKDGKIKKGNLDEWNWTYVSNSKSRYIGNKWINENGPKSTICNGIKIWDSLNAF